MIHEARLDDSGYRASIRQTASQIALVQRSSIEEGAVKQRLRVRPTLIRSPTSEPLTIVLTSPIWPRFWSVRQTSTAAPKVS